MQQEFERNLTSLESVFEFVKEFFSKESVDASHRYAVDLAVEEICTNMVKYSPEGRQEIVIQPTRVRQSAESRRRFT